MSKTVRNLLIAGAAVIVALIAGVIIYNATRPYEVLFTGLNSSDMSAVLTYLDEQGVSNYRVRNSDTILVPANQEANLKAQLLLAGYPSSNYDYRMYLDNVGMLSSSSDRQVLATYDLQDKLQYVIQRFPGVESASVQITLGEDNSYILDPDDKVEAEASVLVTMKGSQTLTTGQVNAIRNLVTHAVAGLDVDNVSIDDTAGNNYTGTGDISNVTDASTLKLALQAQVNNRVRESILAVLVPLFGKDNVSISVNSTVDVSRTYQEYVEYTSPDEGTTSDSLGIHGLIGDYEWANSIDRGDNATAGGVPGTSTNSDLNEYVINEANPDGTEQSIGTTGSIHYENDKTVTQKDNAGGVITDVMVAVTLNSRAVGVVNAEDAEALITHVARAAGISSDIQDEKISILSMPFFQEEVEPTPAGPVELTFMGLPEWVFLALVAGLALFLFLLVLILILRRKRRKKLARRRQAEAEAASMEAALLAAAAAQQQPQGAQIMDLHSERSMELRMQVREFVEQNPEIAAQMIKTWLKGGGDEHG